MSPREWPEEARTVAPLHSPPKEQTLALEGGSYRFLSISCRAQVQERPMGDYEMRCQAEARLAILAELAKQPGASFNTQILTAMIQAIVPRRSQSWLETQMAWLGQAAAIDLRRIDVTGVGPVTVATLARTGRNHVEGRELIPGISKPWF